MGFKVLQQNTPCVFLGRILKPAILQQNLQQAAQQQQQQQQQQQPGSLIQLLELQQKEEEARQVQSVPTLPKGTIVLPARNVVDQSGATQQFSQQPIVSQHSQQPLTVQLQPLTQQQPAPVSQHYQVQQQPPIVTSVQVVQQQLVPTSQQFVQSSSQSSVGGTQFQAPAAVPSPAVQSKQTQPKKPAQPADEGPPQEEQDDNEPKQLLFVEDMKGTIYNGLKPKELDKVIQCRYCPRKFTFLSEHLAHLKKHTQDVDSVVEMSIKIWVPHRIKCDKCKFKTSYTLDYARHKDTHTIRGLACSKCQCEVSTPKAYGEHMEIHHPSVLFSEGSPSKPATPAQDPSNQGKSTGCFV